MRLTAAITLLVLATLIPWYAIAPLALVYVLFYSGWELIGMALLIDAYFGGAHVWPYYTIAASVLVLLFTWLKPRLVAYN